MSKEQIYEQLLNYLPASLTAVAVVAAYYLAGWLLDRQAKGKKDLILLRSIAIFSILLFGAIAFITALPIDDKPKELIINFIGIVVSAVLALSSTTFIGNGLAGIMIRTVNTFGPGDFIEVNEYFGRITQRRFFHSEIQTDNGDLLTLPNLFLVTNAVKVTRTSGTNISGTCSLGYDVNRVKVENALIKAAEKTELSDPFVRILELGDFSIVYQIFGKLDKSKSHLLLKQRSRLKAMMLDCLHEAGIEIVSPSFMNQRQVGDTVFIPKKVKKAEITPDSESAEKNVFDLANEAQSIEQRKEKMIEIDEKIMNLNLELKEANDEREKEKINARITRWKEVKEKMQIKIDEQVDDMDSMK